MQKEMLSKLIKIILSIGFGAMIVSMAYTLYLVSQYPLMPTYHNDKTQRIDDTAYGHRAIMIKMGGPYPLFIISIVCIPLGIMLWVKNRYELSA